MNAPSPIKIVLAFIRNFYIKTFQASCFKRWQLQNGGRYSTKIKKLCLVFVFQLDHLQLAYYLEVVLKIIVLGT